MLQIVAFILVQYDIEIVLITLFKKAVLLTVAFWFLEKMTVSSALFANAADPITDTLLRLTSLRLDVPSKALFPTYDDKIFS